jgi:hypothetical protein
VTDKFETIKDDVDHKWSGQNIRIVLDALGPPDTIKTVDGKNLYKWQTERAENYRILGGMTVTRDGYIETPDQSHFNITAKCTIIIATRTEEHTIIGTRMEGQERTCAQFIEKDEFTINRAPDDASKNQLERNAE